MFSMRPQSRRASKTRTSLTPALALLLLPLTCSDNTAPLRPFTFDDALRLRAPYSYLLSPDGRTVVYAVGDSLWLRETRNDAAPVLLTTGMASLSLLGDPFMAWTPASDAVVFQAGRDDESEADQRAASTFIAERHTSWRRRTLMPDSLDSAIRPINTGNLGPSIAFRYGGPAWSPDGQHLAFYGWRTGEQTWPKLFKFNTRESRLEELTPGSALRAGIAWSPDQRWLAATMDADTAGIVELRESDSGRVTATFAAEGILGDLMWSPDGRRLFVRSNRSSPFILDVSSDGTMQLGSVLPRATYAGWTPAGDGLFASQRVGMGSRLMLVDATSGAVSPLTSEVDVALAVGIGGTAQAPVTVYSVENGSQPRTLWFAELDTDAGLLMRPTRMTHSHSWIDSVALSRTQIFEWYAADSTRLQAQLFLPPEGLVEPGTPTPAVVIPYGGFTNTFPSGDDLMTMGIQVMAAKGWTVVRPNTRGIFGSPQNDRYGALQLEDTDRLLDTLIARRMIDPDRIAVFGHSHGGAMAYYYLTHSDRFAGAIAVNGAADWISQARRRDMTGLPWGLGGTPDELPEKYKAYSPLENVEHARGALLAVAAEDDSQIPPEPTREMVERLQRLGRTADLVWLSDEDHFIRKAENRELMWSRVLDFLSRLFTASSGDTGGSSGQDRS